jgi:putative peptidoglycan lipid II flippase
MSKSPGNGTVIPAALILGVASLLSRLVGLLRERVLTSTFGAGDIFDSFVAAFRLPDLFFNLIVIGALSAAFIPLFTDKLVRSKDGKRQAFDFSLTILNVMLVVMGVISLLYVIFAPEIMRLLTPGFGHDKMQMTIMLSRIMALQPLLLTVSFVFSGVLNSFKRFVAYALAPIVYNVGIIIGVVWLYPRIGIAGLGWGVVLGALLHALVQLPSVLKVGLRWKPVFQPRSTDVRALWRMILPRIFGLAVQQINLVVVTILGSGLLAGSISVFYLANNVQYLPIGIFGLAFAQAAFPTLAEQYSRRNYAEYRHTLSRTFRYILFFVIPISMMLYLLRAQVIRVLYGNGAFDWQDTIATYQTLSYFIMSIFAQATVPLLTRAFYVQQDTKTPVVISIISIVVNIILAYWLSPRYGVSGLAIAFSVSAIVNLVLLLGVLHWKLEGFDDRRVIGSLIRIVAATLLAGITLQFLKGPVAALVDMQRFWGVFTQMAVTSVAGLLVYIGACYLFRAPELKMITRYIPHRFTMKAGMETTRFTGIES